MDVDPLPQADISRILGFLEILEDRGGREDIYKLARDLNYESGDLITVIHAAESLGLVTTPGGDVVLLDEGRRINDEDMNDTKAIMRRRMLKLPLFQYLKKMLEQAEDHRMTRSQVQEELSRILPKENPDSLFRNIVGWGRYAEIFGYNRDHDLFYLDEGETLD